MSRLAIRPEHRAPYNWCGIRHLMLAVFVMSNMMGEGSLMEPS